MLRTFKNGDVYHRIWPSLQTPDGHTVDLDPEEQVQLDLPDNFKDPFLVPVPFRSLTKKAIELPPVTTTKEI